MYNGILIVDKPKDFTSHDVISKLRGILKMRHIGHAGTLDPMATGVLIVLLGKATRASDYLTAEEKVYEASFKLGITTDTQDITGKVIRENPADVSEEAVKECIKSFEGVQKQLPPMYSAVQVNGARLYDLARQGIEVERKAREIEIPSIEYLGRGEEGEYRIRVSCSKGTYIRTLCHDIGEKLGCGGTLTSLRRVKSGDFTEDKSTELSAIETMGERVSELIIPTEYAFRNYNAVHVNEEGAVRAKNGAFISKRHIVKGRLPALNEVVTVFGPEGELLILGECRNLDKGGRGIFCKKSFI